MRLSQGDLYSILAIAVAVAYGAVVGPYWTDDAVFLAVAGLAVVRVYLKKVDSWTLQVDPPSGNPPPRSRIAHFVLISRMNPKMKSSASLDPFERALFGRENWQALSTEDLRRVSVDALQDPSESS